MKPSESRLNSFITPITRVPFGPGGRFARSTLRPAAITRASSLMEGFDFTADSFQQVSIDAGLTAGDFNRTHRSTIKISWTGSSINSVDVSKFTQAIERSNQQ